MSKAIEKEGYYYDPPSWRVCPHCKGFGKQPHPMGNEVVYDRCSVCDGTGYMTIRYTPEQWKAAGGILTDKTPVWIQAIDGKWMEGLYWEHDENSHGTPLVIATSAGPPEEERK